MRSQNHSNILGGRERSQNTVHCSTLLGESFSVSCMTLSVEKIGNRFSNSMWEQIDQHIQNTFQRPKLEKRTRALLAGNCVIQWRGHTCQYFFRIWLMSSLVLSSVLLFLKSYTRRYPSTLITFTPGALLSKQTSKTLSRQLLETKYMLKWVHVSS